MELRDDYSDMHWTELERPELNALKEKFKAGGVAEDKLPQGAHHTDEKTGANYILGVYQVKGQTDAERGIKRMPAALGSVSPTWKPNFDKPLPSIRCTAYKDSGEQCGRWSIRGGNVCLAHGGKKPEVQAAAMAKVEVARLRLIGLTEDAVGVLEDLMASKVTADAVRLKAATEVLDRSGIKGGVDISVEVEHKINPAEAITAKLKEIADRANKGVEAAEEVEDIIDVEEVLPGGEE